MFSAFAIWKDIMLKIRLKRIGKKHQPFYRIVVTEHTEPVCGEYIDKIGHYNPFSKKIQIDKEKALEWMNKGAQPTNTVAKLLVISEIKHKLVVVKKFKAKTKTQLEAENKIDEEKKAKEQAEKAAAKEAFDKEVEEKKIETSVEKTEQETQDKEPNTNQDKPASQPINDKGSDNLESEDK